MGPDGATRNPADVGNVAALLCSEEAGWITGQVIFADGGSSLKNVEVPGRGFGKLQQVEI